jgi:hypothetical protein
MCRYATTAKRVNVRKLKSDIWNHVDKLPSSSLASPQPSLEIINDENKQPNNGYGFGTDHDDGKLLLQKNSSKQTKAASSSTVSAIGEGKMSFQELVRDISSSQNQKDATLPFYFICLLHLANEKVVVVPIYTLHPSIVFNCYIVQTSAGYVRFLLIPYNTARQCRRHTTDHIGCAFFFSYFHPLLLIHSS